MNRNNNSNILVRSLHLFVIALLLVGALSLTPRFTAQAATLQWNKFLGSSNDDYGYAIAVDSSGNLYVTGGSDATWGSPVNAYTGSGDAFVAKLDSSGSLKWHTFMGSSDWDHGKAVAVDGSGNVYVAGASWANWGNPLNAYVGSGIWPDAFVAKLDSSGSLQWNTFMGPSFGDGRAIAVDSSGNVYVAGLSYTTWGTPVNAHAGLSDAFVAKLDSSGSLQWNTFMGSSSPDRGYAIAVDSSGNLYVTGYSEATWSTPLNTYAGDSDAFVAKLDSSGSLQWNTFMGSSGSDRGNAIAVDSSGNVYVAGKSLTTWGTPVNAHTGYNDAFATELNSDGVRQWHTFLGSPNDDNGDAIAVDSNGNVYVAGSIGPDEPYSLNYDAFAAKLDSSGSLQWNTFMGSSDYDHGYAIVVDGSGNIYVTGESWANWDSLFSQLNAHKGGVDAFVAKLVSDSNDGGCFIATTAL